MSLPNPMQSSANLFRRLTWQGSIPLEIRLAEGEPGAGSSTDRYYMHAPRYTYLPLLIPEIRENLVELLLDDQQLETLDESQWWFEEEAPDPESGSFAGQGVCRWHWPLDLIQLHSVISHPSPASASSSLVPPTPPLRLVLHLSNSPTDKLLMSNSIEACKTQWLNQVKEADFVRWRNTNRVTGLKRVDLEAGWDGIVQDDYDLYMRVASRVLPLPVQSASAAPTSSNPPRPASTDPGSSGPKTESAYTIRALPLKIYLPDNAPVIQEIVPPVGPDGKPTTLLQTLHQHLPLLFPSTREYTLAYPIAQGIDVPPDAELAWMASCICGADGWVRVGIRLNTE
ncbi:autophagy protein Apg5-domain-containing protein [Naematelia encephala]|uniref:Autophagy protein 5 n=1 Tax=Naematelia encephala TaxID=71784 RepID=A0A1Y2B989_9TREE|nr:autophagy protein Apg5-domain-containing protein [Naematelia encephala]